ncbi:MAG TPA: hypothetical protein VF723_07995 [Pyrinomonadaceae bacterium]|jgi:hypothetical protein
MRKLLLAVVCALLATSARAVPLSVVNVSAPPINCIFDASCTVVVNDTTAPIELPGSSGEGFLQSRTLKGLPGSPAGGLFGYEYRVDLRQVAGITNIGCVTSVTLNFGPVVGTIDYNGDGRASDEVYVVTGGGLGSVGLASAERTGNSITFTFASPVCAGSSRGKGESSFFWGLVSTRPPRFINASLTQTSGPALTVEARAPRFSPRPGSGTKPGPVNKPGPLGNPRPRMKGK